MTEAELEAVRLKLRIEVHLVLIRMIYSGLANISPAAAQALREKFESLRQDHEKIALRGIPPAYSDLLSAEYQEALGDALSFIEEGMKG